MLSRLSLRLAWPWCAKSYEMTDAKRELPPLPDQPLKAGSLTYKDASGQWRIVQPDEPLFNILLLEAAYFWQSSKQRWEPLYD